MMRKISHGALLMAGLAVLGMAIGVAVWLASPSPAPMPATAATAQAQRAAFEFRPLDEPRPLPELGFTDADGRDLTLGDFRGRLVLLNIWATWCVPCRKEMPTLDRLQAKLGGSDFEVIALSIDRQGLAVVKPFYEELGLKALRIYLDASGKATQTLGTVGVPTTLLIDQQGREIGRVLGPAEWDSPEVEAVIRRYLKRSSAAAPGSAAAPPAADVPVALAQSAVAGLATEFINEPIVSVALTPRAARPDPAPIRTR